MTLTIDDICTAVAVDNRIKDATPFAELSRNDRNAMLVLADARRRSMRLTLSEFARRVGVSRAGMTTIADRLEDRSIAIRKADPEDRRRIHFAISDDAYTELAAALFAVPVAS